MNPPAILAGRAARLGALLAGVIFSFLTGTGFAAPAADTNSPPADWAPPPLAKGPLESVDLVNRRLVLRVAAGPRPFAYTERTYMFRDGQKVGPDKLKAGDIVALRFLLPTNAVPVIHRLKAYSATPVISPTPPEQLPAAPATAPPSP